MSKQKSIFDHINAVFTDQSVNYYDNLSDADKKSFNTYMISMGISMNHNFLPIVNEVNKYWGQLGPREVYLFYSQILPKGRQFNKWVKSNKKTDYDSDVINIVMKHYEVSSHEAIDYIRLYYKDDVSKVELRLLLEDYGFNQKRLKKLDL